jgi:hypothetical protein
MLHCVYKYIDKFKKVLKAPEKGSTLSPYLSYKNFITVVC